MNHAPIDATPDLSPQPDLQVLAGLAPQLASTFVSVAADIALVIDADGVIKHVALGADPIGGSTAHWLGRPWVDTVTGGTRRKIELLLSEVQATGVTRRREVNHPSQEEASDIPVAYSAIRLGHGGPVLAIGRDLRAVAAIQQRFIEATQSMEHDYWVQRQVETQVRTLYHVATDAVLVVDAYTLQVVQANAAAQALLAPRLTQGKCDGFSDGLGGSLVGTDAAASVLHVERPGFTELLATARATGRPGVMRAHAAPAVLGSAPTALVPVEVSATPLRAGPTMQLMVQLRCIDVEPDQAEVSRRRSAWLDNTADALVVTDSSGRVLMCNAAFKAMCQMAPNATAHQRTLAELLGDPGRTLAHTLQQARRQGLAHAPEAFVGHTLPTLALELTAVLLAEGDQECIGLRLCKRPAAADTAPDLQRPDPVEQLTLAIGQLADQMGQLALPQLLQQAATLAERHLITAALARSQGRLNESGLLLGIPVPALQQRMQHLGLTGPHSNVVTAAQHPTLPTRPDA